ncbi:MAG: 50S ribosomal protein L24 [archaeon]
MKSKFNKSWNASVKPRKQRKFLVNAPNHIRRKLMGATLDKRLRAKHGVRSIEVRKGDEVKVMRGKFAKKQGKVGGVDVKNCRIQIDGLQREKKGGEKVMTWFHPSSVKIVVLDDSDKRRFKRKGLESGKVKLREGKNGSRMNTDEHGLKNKENRKVDRIVKGKIDKMEKEIKK